MQQRLFAGSRLDDRFVRSVGEARVPLEEVDVGDVTFLSGQRESVHRWYRLTPSFAPGLVRYLLRELDVGSSDLVYDPFAGRGTTAIECQKGGVPCVGGEINPLLMETGRRSLRWDVRAVAGLRRFPDELAERIRAVRGASLSRLVDQGRFLLPDIHNVARWWRPEVLRDLLIARELAREAADDPAGNYYWLAVNAACLDCANIHRNHPTITFDDGHDRAISVLAETAERCRAIADDLQSLTPAERDRSGSCRIDGTDACGDLSGIDVGGRSPTVVVTSPPYPNRFSYVHQTRPQLHFMEVIDDRREATEIDLRTVGGTWGRATSNLTRSLIEPPARLRDALCYFEELRDKSLLMCNYATKYFLDLDRHARALRAVVPNGFRGAYVVGNSRLSGVEIYTETILTRLFVLAGFQVEKILVFRKRGGRKRLYETAVIVRS